ncbi:MAG: glutamate-1-semialdehyde-2,1-aminomutase [Spirochaetae bacterium HGW-Spirochaetae-1]|jgi:glutamate-1-semialdehyde 2,1-aminomutase|nr:MAG: glutamate-1-semialdehyde-2,1-aminomutase [Spirochaetae bacterium HGW-Spirochaetae-1]
MNTKNSALLYAEALKLLPGGVDSPVRAFRSVGGDPLFMKRGVGSRIFDEDNNEYIDYCMSWGPLILGHADPDVVKAVQITAESGTSFGTPHKYEVELAKLVTGSFPSIKKIRFVNSGTEAVMSAIRLARGFTGRDKFIKFDGCYHGHADHLLVAAGSGLATLGTPDSAGVTAANAGDTIVLPFNDLDALAACLSENDSLVAAVIMEPVPCNYGLIMPSEKYLQGVRSLCTRHNVVLIFDEVITGYRLSDGGAQKYYGIEADLTTLGKIIGGGLPVGAYGGREDIMKMVAPDGPVYQAGTLSGNPLAMAAGIATLKKLVNGSPYVMLQHKADYFRDILKPSLAKYEGRFLFQQIGSVFSFCFTDKKTIISVDDIKKGDMKLFARFHHEMLSKGVYLAPSGYEVGFISLAHSDEDLIRTADAVSHSLAAVLG